MKTGWRLPAECLRSGRFARQSGTVQNPGRQIRDGDGLRRRCRTTDGSQHEPTTLSQQSRRRRAGCVEKVEFAKADKRPADPKRATVALSRPQTRRCGANQSCLHLSLLHVSITRITDPHHRVVIISTTRPRSRQARACRACSPIRSTYLPKAKSRCGSHRRGWAGAG